MYVHPYQMSSPFAFLKHHALRAEKEAKWDVEQQVNGGMIPDTKEARNELFWRRYEINGRRALREIELMKRMKEMIGNEFQSLLTNTIDDGKRYYMITIRPVSDVVDFNVFKDKIETLVHRACFLDYVYSFEQKGTSPTELGTGFHVHIVAAMKQRSKAEVLRDVVSTFNPWIAKGWIASNCIDVRITKNPTEVVQNYLIDYKSDDGHKETTKTYDDLWRSEKNLKNIYLKDGGDAPTLFLEASS